MKPIWKWVIGIFLSIVVALGGILWYFSRNWRPLVEDKLAAVVKNSSDSLYWLTYDDMDLKLVLDNVTLTKVKLVPGSVVYQQKETAQKPHDNPYDIRLKSLKIKRFDILDVLRSRMLNIR